MKRETSLPVLRSSEARGHLSTALTIDIAASPTLPAALADAWDGLVLRSGWASPNILLGSQECWWRHRGRNHRRATVAAWRGDRLVGLLPLAISTFARIQVGTVPADGWGLQDGVVVDSAEGDDVAAALLAATAGLGVQYVSWNGLRAGSRIDRAIGGGRLRTTERFPAPLLDIDGSIDDVLRRRPGGKAPGAARRRRRLMELGDVRLETASTAVELATAIPAMFELHHRRWGPGSASPRVDRSMMRSADGRTVQRELLLALAPAGVVRLTLMRVGERPVAFALWYLVNGWMVCDRQAFDPAFAKQGPGFQVIIAAIAAAAEEGAVAVNLGHGADSYKKLFTDREIPVHQGAAGTGTLRGHLAAAASIEFRARRRALGHHPRVRRLYEASMRYRGEPDANRG